MLLLNIGIHNSTWHYPLEASGYSTSTPWSGEPLAIKWLEMSSFGKVLISTWDRLISPFCWSGPGPAATPGMQKGYQARAAPELRVAAAPQRAVPRNVTKVPCLAASKGNPANC